MTEERKEKTNIFRAPNVEITSRLFRRELIQLTRQELDLFIHVGSMISVFQTLFGITVGVVATCLVSALICPSEGAGAVATGLWVAFAVFAGVALVFTVLWVIEVRQRNKMRQIVLGAVSEGTSSLASPSHEGLQREEKATVDETKEQGNKTLGEIEKQRKISNLMLEVDDMLNREKNPKAALEAAKDVIQLDPNNIKALSYIGLIHNSSLKNETLAAETYEKMVEIIRNVPEKTSLNLKRLSKYHKVLAQLYASMGKEDRMLLNFRKAHNINPGIVIDLLGLKIFTPYKEKLLKEFPDLKQDF